MIAMPTYRISTPITETRSGTYELSRLNAVRHGVLSRHTVLPWEDEKEYQALLADLTTEHDPRGQTEQYLVQEMAAIMWRKSRLRLAEASLHRSLVKNASSRILNGDDEIILSTIRHPCPQPPPADQPSQPQEKEDFLTQMQHYQQSAMNAVELLKTSSTKATYNRALELLHGHSYEWWYKVKIREDTVGLRHFLLTNVIPWCERRVQFANSEAEMQQQAFIESLNHPAQEKLARYEVALDRKFERTVAMLLKLQELRRGVLSSSA
jgi:hypothetical protein